MRVLIVSADLFEDSELLQPLRELRARGVVVDVAAPHAGLIIGKHGHKIEAERALALVDPKDYDLLIVPGGKAPEKLRRNADAVAIARHFLAAGKPVAAICHGPQLLVATGLLAGRKATCYRDVRRELEAAGVAYEDREVVIDDDLITSRRPDDIPAFLHAIFRVLERLAAARSGKPGRKTA